MTAPIPALTQSFEPVREFPNPFHIDRTGGKNLPDHASIGGIVLNEKYTVLLIVRAHSPGSELTRYLINGNSTSFTQLMMNTSLGILTGEVEQQ